MQIKFNCPHCDQRIEAAGEIIGTIITCPTCIKPFRIRPSSPPDLAHTDVKVLLQTLWSELKEFWEQNSFRNRQAGSAQQTPDPQPPSSATGKAQPARFSAVSLSAAWPQSRIGNIVLAALLTFIFCQFSKDGWIVGTILGFVVYVIARVIRWVFLKFRLASIDAGATLMVESRNEKFGFSSRKWEACFSGAIAACLAFVFGWFVYCNLSDAAAGLENAKSDNVLNMVGIAFKAANSDSSDANGLSLLFDAISGISRGGSLENESQSVEIALRSACTMLATTLLTGILLSLFGAVLYYKGLKAVQRRLVT